MTTRGILTIVALALRTGHSVGYDVDSDAELFGVRAGIGGEKMTMARTEFPDEGGLRSKDLLQLSAELGFAPAYFGQMRRRSGRTAIRVKARLH